MIYCISESKNNYPVNFSQSPLTEACLCEMEVYGLYVSEAAKFSFMPRLKQHEELKQLWNVCQKAEDELNEKGETPSAKTIHKLGKIALRIFSIYHNISNVIYTASTARKAVKGAAILGSYFGSSAIGISCATFTVIFSIPVYLIYRVIDYGVQLGEYAIAENYAKECIKSFGKLKKETKDPKEKEKIDEQIEKLNKKLKEAKEKK